MNLILMLLICVTTFIQTAQGIDTKKATTVTYRSEDIEREEGLSLFSPVDASPEGIKNFLQHVYNRQEYIEILPTNLSHITQFLKYGKKNNQSRAYVKSVVKLFSNKLKGVQCLNAYAYSLMLGQMPDLLSDYFLIKRPTGLTQYKDTLNSILYQTFLAKYDFFKKSPQEFFDALSQEIIETLQHDLPALSDDISTDELRNTLVRFLEIGINKLVWHPEEYGKIWSNVKTISRQLEALMENNIIDDANDLDDLYWTLIHRLTYFIDLAHDTLPAQFFETIKTDINSEQLLLVELEEQEALITSKRDHLLHIVRTSLARKQGVAKGLIVS
jgi:hypothetical protein